MTTAKVIRFNWPKDLGALAIGTAALAAGAARAPGWIRCPLWAACVPGGLWTLTSLAATWWVYDHRMVYQRLTAGMPDAGEWAAVHAGFDDSVPALRASIGRPPAIADKIPVSPGASLRRARKLSEHSSADGLPLTASSLDSIFVTFAAHEVRDTPGQRALFTALRRALRPGGCNTRRVPAVSLLTLNLTVTGVLLVGLGALHIALPAVLGWHRELAGASPLNREVSYVHCYFIGLACVLWGLLPLTADSLLLQPSKITRLVLIGAVVFWASRLIIQLAVFNRHARQSVAWLALSTVGTMLWLYLTTV